MRLETGIVQAHGDWPGVFIRGDDAFGYLQSLRKVLAAVPDPAGDTGLTVTAFAKTHLQGLVSLLESSNVHSPKHKTDAVRDIAAL